MISKPFGSIVISGQQKMKSDSLLKKKNKIKISINKQCKIFNLSKSLRTLGNTWFMLPIF